MDPTVTTAVGSQATDLQQVQPVVGPVLARKSRKKAWAFGIAGGVLAVVVIATIANGVNAGGDVSNPNSAGNPLEGVASQPADEPTPAAEETPKVVTVTVPDLTGKTVAEVRTLLGTLGIALGSAGGAHDDWTVSGQTPAAGTTDDKTKIRVTLKADPPMTLEQENALESARDYLDYSAFSRAGLIQQLSSKYGEGYPLAVATWAVDHAGADWNAEAVESAKSYLDTTSFSRQGLFEQLTSKYGEGFTPDQANYALKQVGY